MESNKHKIWQLPWGYSEAVTVVAGILLVGCCLQWAVGAFDYSLIQWPVNLLLGGLILLLIIGFLPFRKRAFSRWFSGLPVAVTLTGSFVLLGMIMGLTPQLFLGAEPQAGLPNRLGFDNMTSSWPFVLLYLLTLLSLGMLIGRRLVTFRRKDYAFYLNHIGLWLVLFAAGLGAADIKRYVMHLYEGETEWRVYNDNKDILDLPIAIQLNDFFMEEYPPKLAVVVRETGAVLPLEKPCFFQIDKKVPEGTLPGWEICLDKYIHDAVRKSDTTYREALMPGATPAAHVSMRNTVTGKTVTGWVSAGNSSQLYMTLTLDDHHALVMTRPEPKRFVSDIHVYTEDGRNAHALLEVNKPLRIGEWMLYQYDYDKEAGRMSAYSSIELVYDPWLIPVYVGLALLMMGAVCMLWRGNYRKEGRHGLE